MYFQLESKCHDNMFIFQHSCIYVKRSGKFQEETAVKQLDTIVQNDTPVSARHIVASGPVQ